MAGSPCKAALCAGSCLYAIVDDQTREVTQVTVTLAANNQLTEDQLAMHWGTETTETEFDSLLPDRAASV